MKYKKVVRLYSNSRVAKYYRATNRNKNKAVMLYFANMKIAQAFHPLLSSFEVILRNQLHYALAHHFSDGNWIINQKTGFMIAPSLTYTNKRKKKKFCRICSEQLCIGGLIVRESIWTRILRWDFED